MEAGQEEEEEEEEEEAIRTEAAARGRAAWADCRQGKFGKDLQDDFKRPGVQMDATNQAPIKPRSSCTE